MTVATDDLATAVAFYGDTLGLRRSAHDPERGFAEFETGNPTLNVIVAEKMGMAHYVTPNAIALHVPDMDAARARLQDAGVTFAGETFDTGVCLMAFSDPNGNALMLHHRYAPRVAEG